MDATVCGCDLIFTAFLLLKTYWLRKRLYWFRQRPPLAALIIIYQHCSYVLKRLRFNGSFILDYVFFFVGSCLISQIFLDCSTVLLQADYLWHPGKTLMPFKNPQLLFPLDQVGFADSSEIWGTVIWEMENNFLFTGCLHATPYFQSIYTLT